MEIHLQNIPWNNFLLSHTHAVTQLFLSCTEVPAPNEHVGRLNDFAFCFFTHVCMAEFTLV